MSGLRLHGIPNCDTVKRARAWLSAQGVAHSFHDFKRDGLPEPLLDGWLAAVGPARLLNRAGTTWRRLADTQRAQAGSAEGTRALLLAQPSLVKRPVVLWPGGAVTVGFDEADWQHRIGA